MGVAAATALAAPAAPQLAAAPAHHHAKPALRLVQRSCACGAEAGLTGNCAPCSAAKLQPERAAGAPVASRSAPAVVYQALRGLGHPLDGATRGRLEPQLGHDFSRVRVHTGPVAEASAQAVSANAYTVGTDVVFGAGQYRPGTLAGDRLLAHELTHTIQQEGAPLTMPLRIGPADDAHEHAAATAALSFRSAAPTAIGAAGVQRQLIQRQAIDAPAAAPPAAVPAPDLTPGAATTPDAAQTPESSGFVADAFWAIVKRVAPAPLLNVIQGIRGRGIVGYLRDRLSGVMGRVFGGLSEGGGFIAGLLGAFTQMAATARTLIAALAHNDCKPLFDAIGQLGDILSEMAGEAWDKIKAFFAPIGDFFSQLWQKFGAPAVDFLKQYASDQWDLIKSIGNQLWELSAPVRETAQRAWDWLKRQLGIGDGPDDQNGLLQWVEGKLGEAWDWIKKQAEPIVTPIKAFAAQVAAALPIDTILNLRQRVHEWLSHAGDMVRTLQKPHGAATDQASLREKILPAIKASIVALGGRIAAAGDWAAHQIGGLVQGAANMLDALRANPIVGAFSGALQWIADKISALGEWVQDGVKALFGLAGQGVQRLSGFVDPLLAAVAKLVAVVANVVKALPELVLGPFWKVLPACIKDPIKDFVIQHILSAIPVISTFVKVPEIWAKIKQLVLDFLSAVFVKGDLAGAAAMVIRFVLEAVGVNVELLLSILGKAADTLDDIIMHPVSFLGNLFGALKLGLEGFVKNLWDYLKQGVLDWVLGPLASLGITLPKSFTVESVLDLVLQVLGITKAKLRSKLEKALGPTAVAILERAWSWIAALVTGGVAGLWAEIKSQLSNLWDLVIGGISSWVTTKVILPGVARLAAMANPVGAIVKAIQTIYETVTFIVTKMNSILALVDGVVSSLSDIVHGKIAGAALLIQNALGKGLSLLICFVADWLGIPSPGEAIRDIVEKLQLRVDAALDWLVNKAIALVRGAAGGKEAENPKWAAGVTGVNQELDALKKSAGDDLAEEQIRAKFPDWKTKYGFTDLLLNTDEQDDFEITGAMSPHQPVASAHSGLHTGSSRDPIPIVWYKAPGAYPKSFSLTDPFAAGNPSFTVDMYSRKTLTYPNKGESVTIGVRSDNEITVGKKLRRTAGTAGLRTGEQDRLRRILSRYGYDMTNTKLDADHVKDLAFGGDDDLNNLWPLDEDVNRRGLRYVGSYKVKYVYNRKIEETTLRDLDDKYFCVQRFGGNWPEAKAGGDGQCP